VVVAVGENLRDAERNLELARLHPELRPAAGLYPTELDEGAAAELAAFVRLNRDALVAIGEVGLDHWKVKGEEERGLQRRIFSLFVDLSIETGLPLNVHSRSAGRHAIALLLERGARGVQLHAFDGKASSALPAAEAGYYFSIPPSIVRSRQKQKLVGRLPLERLLLESDSPVLGAAPGERNEPSGVMHALTAIAEIKGLDPGCVAEAMRENALALYGRAIRG